MEDAISKNETEFEEPQKTIIEEEINKDEMKTQGELSNENHVKKDDEIKTFNLEQVALIDKSNYGKNDKVQGKCVTKDNKTKLNDEKKENLIEKLEQYETESKIHNGKAEIKSTKQFPEKVLNKEKLVNSKISPKTIINFAVHQNVQNNEKKANGLKKRQQADLILSNSIQTPKKQKRKL